MKYTPYLDIREIKFKKSTVFSDMSEGFRSHLKDNPFTKHDNLSTVKKIRAMDLNTSNILNLYIYSNIKYLGYAREPTYSENNK